MARFILVRNPGFGCFWFARLVSYFGSAVTIAALVLYVYESEGSGVAVGLLLLAETLPRLLAPPRENGILDHAEGNAEDSLRAFVTTLGYEEVRFE